MDFLQTPLSVNLTLESDNSTWTRLSLKRPVILSKFGICLPTNSLNGFRRKDSVGMLIDDVSPLAPVAVKPVIDCSHGLYFAGLVVGRSYLTGQPTEVLRTTSRFFVELDKREFSVVAASLEVARIGDIYVGD
jgi:hypothetical protein